MGLVDRGRMPAPLTKLLNLGRSYSMWVYQWGLACCAIEMGAAFASPRYDVMRLGVIPLPASPRQADLVVISGTVTDKMAPADPAPVRPDARAQVRDLDGSCANCGGPYWDSYSVTKGVDQIIPVDIYVPGCPPRPEALLEGIVLLQQRIKNEDMAAKWRDEEYTSIRLTEARESAASRSWSGVGRLSDTARPTTPALPGDALREGIVDELRAAHRRAARRHTPHARRRPVGTRRTEAWAAGCDRAEVARLRLLLLPVGDRLDAVAVRQGRGRSDRTARRARPRRSRSSRGTRAARRDSRCSPVSPTHASRRRHAQGRRARRRWSMPTWIRVLRRCQLARARDPRDVRHRLRRPPRPAQHVPAGRFEGYPLRKDFPLLARMVKPWPGIVDVEPMPGEPTDDEAPRRAEPRMTA